jgi:hypothetical protein
MEGKPAAAALWLTSGMGDGSDFRVGGHSFPTPLQKKEAKEG